MPLNIRKPYRSVRLVLFAAFALLLTLPLFVQAQDTMDGDSVFVSVRLYEGIEPSAMNQVRVLPFEEGGDGFLNIIKDAPGYVGYYRVLSDDSVAIVHMTETAEQADASNELARDYVAENLAPLLPNPPQVVQGMVSVEYAAALHDMMMAADVSSLYASVRIYADFDIDNADENARRVEDGFLPLLQDTDGFFGYYVMDDGVDTLVAMSVFESEEAALASNEMAREFVAAELAEFLPSDPSITAGNVSVASLAGVDGGNNLIDDDRVFVSIRIYRDVTADARAELSDVAFAEGGDGFLNIVKDAPGYVGYYRLLSDDSLAVIHLTETVEQARASTEMAREYVAENIAPLLPTTPQVIEGAADVSFANALEGDLMDGADVGSLHASVRVYEGVDGDNLYTPAAVFGAKLLPMQRETDGFFSYYVMSDGVDRVVAVSIFASAEAALATNGLARQIVIDDLTPYLPNLPTITAGQLIVASLAGLAEGGNIIDAPMMDG